MQNVYESEVELGIKVFILEVTGNLAGTRKVLAETEATFPVLLDSSDFSRNVLNVMGTPTTFVVDENGRIRCRLVGKVEELTEVIREIIHYL